MEEATWASRKEAILERDKPGSPPGPPLRSHETLGGSLDLSMFFLKKKIYIYLIVVLISVQFSGSVMSSSLWPHGLQHARSSYPSPTPRACSNSCTSSQSHVHPTISSSVVPFSFCLQSFLASGSFPMSQFLASGGQSIGVLIYISLMTDDV